MMYGPMHVATNVMAMRLPGPIWISTRFLARAEISESFETEINSLLL
jgi:hypothetical protein